MNIMDPIAQMINVHPPYVTLIRKSGGCQITTGQTCFSSSLQSCLLLLLVKFTFMRLAGVGVWGGPATMTTTMVGISYMVGVSKEMAFDLYNQNSFCKY